MDTLFCILSILCYKLKLMIESWMHPLKCSKVLKMNYIFFLKRPPVPRLAFEPLSWGSNGIAGSVILIVRTSVLLRICRCWFVGSYFKKE